MLDIFEECQKINNLILEKQIYKAREELIKLLDIYKGDYPYYLNYFIRELGLYPYLGNENLSWQERYVKEIFSINIGEDKILLHREQSKVLNALLSGSSIALSAPTSFGKSFIIDAFIEIKKPNNVVIILPTIALMDETRRRLYKRFSYNYKIITTTDIEISEKNIFIFPQERVLSYIDKLKEIDLLIIDEFYKASTKFDKDRASTLISAIIKLSVIAKQRYFLAPNISSIKKNPLTRDMTFLPIDFNTVYLNIENLYHENITQQEKYNSLIHILENNQEKTLIYAGTFREISFLSENLIKRKDKNCDLLNSFSNWIKKNYGDNNKLYTLVKKGIGIHTGKLHRSLSQIQIKLFEDSEKGLDNIISTSSIIEGVNTSAKNVIVWSNRNGSLKLDYFTFKNILGRSGRMFRHFIGNVFLLSPSPKEAKVQLEIELEDNMLPGIDESKYKENLTPEQISKIIQYKSEVSEYLDIKIFNYLVKNNLLQTHNFEKIKNIIINMSENKEYWSCLSSLNSNNEKYWESALFRILSLSGFSGCRYSDIVNFIKKIKNNWKRTIPEQLNDLNIDLDNYFYLEKLVSYNFSCILHDINEIQKIILSDKNIDISPFINSISTTFLPKVVFQLEEFGLPRMIAKKIQDSSLYNFEDNDLYLDIVLKALIDKSQEIKNINTLDPFDKYILDYFFDGISS